MTDYLNLPLDEKHLEPILARKNDIISCVEQVVAESKIQRVLRPFEEKLEQLRLAIRDCNLLNTQLREMSPLEHVFLGIGDVLRDANIPVDYGRKPDPESLPKPSVAEPAVKAPAHAPTSSQASVLPEDAQARPRAIIPLVQPDEFETIPKYMRGRMTNEELNEEPPTIAGQLFCEDVDVKQGMRERTKNLFRAAVPCLRHVKRIKEVRVKGKAYFMPY
ncbi:unnamed protein product [Nippostrongylus brasiliensis]|uniref:SKA complex subunit 1 n=1 Tax=Nippostrongylus brasiliensis TaxID=27835 RepID=A0A0N4YFK2_NIPBR|nr:unnamed protein product [Nippostrongylus brasiliensis]